MRRPLHIAETDPADNGVMRRPQHAGVEHAEGGQVPPLPKAAGEERVTGRPSSPAREGTGDAPVGTATAIGSSFSRTRALDTFSYLSQRFGQRLAPEDLLPGVDPAAAAVVGGNELSTRERLLTAGGGGLEPRPSQPGRPEAPTIKVSIGRVEVRAVMAQQLVAKAPAPSPPKVSLDDYLRRQSGGGK